MGPKRKEGPKECRYLSSFLKQLLLGCNSKFVLKSLCCYQEAAFPVSAPQREPTTTRQNGVDSHTFAQEV